MIPFDLTLNRDHYYIKKSKVVEEISFNKRYFLSKYDCFKEPLTDEIINIALKNHHILATSILGKLDYFILDYNGDDRDYFLHKAIKLLRTLDYAHFRAYHSKTAQHLHLYIFCGLLSAPQREELGKIFSNKLEEKLQKQWRIFPNSELPEAYNIINLPHKLYRADS